MLEFLARKILTTRMWNNEEEEKKWSKSVTDKGYEILLVSQFTLFHKFKGTRLGMKIETERNDRFLEAFWKRYLLGLLV